MKTALLAAVAAAVLLGAGNPARAQAPRPVPPKDPATPMPSYSLQSLWQDIDCECDCECCERIKGLIKQRLKDPRGRPQLESPREIKKSRRERDMEKRKRRLRHPRGTKSMWDRPWPRSGNRWLDGARMHRYRRARERARHDGHGLDLDDDQRERVEDIRYRTRMEGIDLEAELEKRELELKRALRGEPREPDEKSLRGLVDAVAKARADLQYHRLMARIEWRRVLTDEQREKLERRGTHRR